MKAKQVVFGIILLFLSFGCTYNQGGLIRRDVKSVYVPIFQNHSFDRGLEFGLSRALIDEIQRKTALEIVSDRSRAQTELDGVIFDFKRTVLNENSIDQVRELQVTVALRFRWTDLDRRRTLVNEPYFRETSSARFEIGETVDDATQEALRLVAQRIVERLESSW